MIYKILIYYFILFNLYLKNMISIYNKIFYLEDLGVKYNTSNNIHFEKLHSNNINKFNSIDDFKDAFYNKHSIYYLNKEDNYYYFLIYNYLNEEPIIINSVKINGMLFNINNIFILDKSNNCIIDFDIKVIKDYIDNKQKYNDSKLNYYIIDKNNNHYTNFMIDINDIKDFSVSSFNLSNNIILNNVDYL